MLHPISRLCKSRRAFASYDENLHSKKGIVGAQDREAYQSRSKTYVFLAVGHERARRAEVWEPVFVLWRAGTLFIV